MAVVMMLYNMAAKVVEATSGCGDDKACTTSSCDGWDSGDDGKVGG